MSLAQRIQDLAAIPGCISIQLLWYQDMGVHSPEMKPGKIFRELGP
jgi:hypothetical protein